MTGDIAEFEPDGCYRVVDRKKDILITSGGKNVAPAAVENALKASPYISEAVIFGDGKKYLTALIEVNFDALAQLGAFARRAIHRFTDAHSASGCDVTA